MPTNWILFKLIGRVEWAWAAVPIIAIGGALGVLQAAQLDIGFVRSRTEIAVVEMQPGYDRAHLTRYIGFYTSLSSDYKITGTDESTILQPFAVAEQQTARDVSLYQGGDGVSLTGFRVVSNSTAMVHTEQISSMGGAISFTDTDGQRTLRNDTDHSLSGAAIVRRTVDDVVEIAWLGNLGSKETRKDIEFTPLKTVLVDFPEWAKSSATSRNSGEGDLNIRGTIDLATDPKRIGVGETVMVGWNDTLLPGIEVKPKASQVTARALFVVQLKHAIRPNPLRDKDSFAALDRELKERRPTGAISY